MSNWKDYLKTSPKMSTKPSKEPKSSKKKAAEGNEGRSLSPVAKVESFAESSSEEDSGAPQVKPRSNKVASKPAPVPEEDTKDDHPPTAQDAQYQLVSHKKRQAQPKAEDLCGKFCDKSLYTKKGIIFNILNNQCHGTSQFVRALRIELSDPVHLNKYLETNFAFLKKTAVLHVHDYYSTSRVNLGMATDLTLDEYSPSFTFASLSDEGKSMLPNGEQEGPLWYGLFPQLLKKVELRTLPDGSIDSAYVVNFRIHQVNPNIRIRNPEVVTAAAAPTSAPRRNGRFLTLIDPSTKKGGNYLGPRTGATIAPPPIKISKPIGKSGSEVIEALSVAISAQEMSRSALQRSQEVQREMASLKTDRIYPDLPEPQAPNWPQGSVIPPLPDNY
jgi:hypothetical protein